MTDQDFQYIRQFLRERCAIVLEPGKEYLVEARLTPVAKQLSLGSISELVGRMRTQPSNGLHAQVIEAMVTTETSFFRDHHPFETLRKTVIPELLGKRRAARCLNIWCAASSTGQEPYSLAMLIREHFPELANWNLLLLASDLSSDVLARAREGRFSQLEVNRGLPAPLLLRHFQQHGTTWQLNDNVRTMVDFRQINLSRPWPFLPRMDLILIRNVMIYFEVETKRDILRRMSQLLRPDGYLILGGVETTFGIDDGYRRVEALKTGFYQLVG
jgi:chemotaxis protein methyltransferase CheR